ILRGELSGHFPYSATGTCSLVAEYLYESSPTRVTNAFGKVMISHQAFDMQVFNGNLIKFFDELIGRFVEKITAQIGDPLMFLCQSASGFVAVFAAAFLFADLPLGKPQFLFCLAVVAGILYHFTGGERREVLKTNINAYGFAGFRKPF